MLIHNAFTILSQAYARIGAIGLEVIEAQDTPRQPVLQRKMIIASELYSTIMAQIILNDDGDAIAGVIGTNYDDLNDLILWLKKETGASGTGFPTPLQTRVVTESAPPGPQGESIVGPAGRDSAAYDFAKINQTEGTIDVDTFALADARACRWEYNIYNTDLTALRTGTIKAIWNGTTLKYAEGGSPDIIGTEPPVTLQVVIDGDDIKLQAIITGDDTWTIDGERRFTPTNGSATGPVSSNLPDGYTFFGDVNNQAAAKQFSGAFTVNREGVATLADDHITNDKIKSDAAIAFSKMEALTPQIGLGTDNDGFATPLTGAVTTILFNDLDVALVVVTHPTTGKITVSAISIEKLNHLSDVSSPIQGQLGGKVNKTGDSMSGALVNTATLEARQGIRTKSSGPYFKTEVVEIGPWNLNYSVGGSDNVVVPHGIADYKKIRGIAVIIRDDSDTNYYNLLGYVNTSNANQSGGVSVINGANITIQLNTGAATDFNTGDFDLTAGPYNRGWVLITYDAS